MKSTKPLLSWELLPLLLLLLIFTGCPNPCSVQQTEKRYVTPPANSAGIEGEFPRIKAADYDEIVIAGGRKIWVDFPCKPVAKDVPKGVEVKIDGNSALIMIREKTAAFINNGGKSAKTTQNINATFTPMGNAQSLNVFFSSPNFTLKLTPKLPVLPGDANADGRRTMMDLFPIALATWKFGPNGLNLGGVPNLQAGPPPSPLDPNMFYNRTPTGAYWSWNATGQQIDFAHADCNLDGVVDQDDAATLYSLLEPAMLPDMLTGGYTGIELEAVQNGPIEILPAIANPNSSEDQARAWYDIRLAGTTKEDSILGVIFTRCVSEVPNGPQRYRIDTMQANTDNSDLIGAPQEMLGLQRFWRDSKIDVVDSCLYHMESVPKLLDVGIFNVNNPQRMTAGHQIISCGVTIDDIMRVVQTGAPIFQHNINAVVFKLDNGGVSAHAVDCSLDRATVDTVGKIVHEKPPKNWPTGSGRNGGKN
ncbi:MAG: hypothetical protein AAF570_17885 [Bacteroidota bacterium]